MFSSSPANRELGWKLVHCCTKRLHVASGLQTRAYYWGREQRASSFTTGMGAFCQMLMLHAHNLRRTSMRDLVCEASRVCA